MDGVEYLLDFAWNTRDSRWYVSIKDADGVSLVESCAVVVDYPLFRKYASARLPPGYLMAIDTSGAGEDMTEMEDLGVRVQLVYLSEDEVSAL
jgi:hypothetical protein